MSDKIKKLSDAIRLGATFRPQCFNVLFGRGGSCALGAAYEVLTGINEEKYYEQDKAPAAGPLIQRRFGVSDFIICCITSRNDSGETREQIADWLESIGL